MPLLASDQHERPPRPKACARLPPARGKIGRAHV
jgi:hypothetical protein